MGEMQKGWDGKKWVYGTFTVIDDARKKEPPQIKIAEPSPKCIVRQCLVYIRYAKPTDVTPNFGAYPAFWGSRADCLEWAKAKGKELNLSVFEAETENPDLRAKEFAPAGIYLIHEQFDQWSPNARGRIFLQFAG